MTSYAVLHRTGTAAWALLSHVEAHNPESAVRAIATDSGGVFVAVPSRSWKPMRVQVETARRVSVEVAKEASE